MSNGILNAGHTGSKTCVVLCKLPHGLILESGYSVKNGNVVRTPEYKRVKLAGSNLVTLQIAAENPGAPVVSTKHVRAGITVNVDESFFDAWAKAHYDSNLIRNRLVTKCENLAEAQAKAMDDAQRPMGMEPRPQVTKEGKFELKKFDAEDTGKDAAAA